MPMLLTRYNTCVCRTRTGAFQGMAQRLDSENELITCDANGRLLMWDCDYRDPVQVGCMCSPKSTERFYAK